MANKTWTATDITKNETIGILQLDGGVIQFVQGYKFKDANGEIIVDIADRTNIVVVAFADLPNNIKTALQDIQTHLYNIAKTKEGM